MRSSMFNVEIIERAQGQFCQNAEEVHQARGGQLIRSYSEYYKKDKKNKNMKSRPEWN